MSWFRLEGRGAFHHKVLAAGNEAYGAWCRAGQWCSDQLTDGLVPRSVAEQIAKPKVWAKLVEARLMVEVDGGYQIHDYLDWNPSSEQERAKREAMREKRREAGRAGGKRSGEVRRGEADAKLDGSNHEANPKHFASTGTSSGTKQNEPPNPNPIPEEEQTHTHRASAPARVQFQGEGPRPCTEAELADLLRETPLLADIADDPAELTDLHSGFVMVHGDAASTDLARRALGTLVSRENLRDTSVRHRRERAGSYLASQRRERASEPVVMSPDVRVALEVFADVWAAKKGRAFVQAQGDEKHAAALVELAREHAGRLKIQGRDVVRHWAEQYLRDGEKFVADPEHPLRLLPSRVTSYGLPRGTGGRRPALATPPPELPAVVAPPDALAALSGLGQKGNAMAVRRPS